jgi:hypothetical protein
MWKEEHCQCPIQKAVRRHDLLPQTIIAWVRMMGDDRAATSSHRRETDALELWQRNGVEAIKASRYASHLREPGRKRTSVDAILAVLRVA